MKTINKKFISIFLVTALIFLITSTVFAAENGVEFIDVSSDAWYANAVTYLQENNLMDGFFETVLNLRKTMLSHGYANLA